MPTEVQIAVAGSGKTTAIAERVADQPDDAISLAITFTLNGQQEIASRLDSRSSLSHETSGWFSFLLRHFIKPYIPALFPQVTPAGLCFVEAEGQIPRGRGGWKYYFNDLHQPYSARLGLLAKKIVAKVGPAPFDRLAQIYSHLYIDEVQDLRGNDLEILEGLMRTSLNVFITGDPRQSVIATSKSDRLHRQYRGAQLIAWFEKQRDQGNCALTFSSTTHRFNETIAAFTDLIHDPSLGFEQTRSRVQGETTHRGVFLVEVDDINIYCAQFDVLPTVLWSRKSSIILPPAEILTFGKSKGLTRKRTVIIATKPMVDWMKAGTTLKPDSAAGFYVAATRAETSVALAVKGASQVEGKLRQELIGIVQLWTPPA